MKEIKFDFNNGYAYFDDIDKLTECSDNIDIEDDILDFFNSHSKYKYEYPKAKLKGERSKYIRIPTSVILDTGMDFKRVIVLMYFRLRHNIEGTIGFTAPDIVEWCGGKPDRRINGTNERYLNVLDDLRDKGYLEYSGERNRSTFMKCSFNIDYYNEECNNGYGVVYLDEIRKILKYRKENTNDSSVFASNILLVFAYLRSKINRRSNELKPEERSKDGILDRRIRCPEAYNTTLNDVASDVGLSSKTVTKIIDVLECELGLIVTERAYRVKNDDGSFRTLQTIFANAYKRDGEFMLVTGKDYSRTEIELKAEIIKKYCHSYKIDKRKRREKGDSNSE